MVHWRVQYSRTPSRPWTWPPSMPLAQATSSVSAPRTPSMSLELKQLYIRLRTSISLSIETDPFADALDEPFGHRAPLARELIHTGAQVRTQLLSRISDIADLAELVEGVTVVLKDRR